MTYSHIFHELIFYDSKLNFSNDVISYFKICSPHTWLHIIFTSFILLLINYFIYHFYYSEDDDRVNFTTCRKCKHKNSFLVPSCKNCNYNYINFWFLFITFISWILNYFIWRNFGITLFGLMVWFLLIAFIMICITDFLYYIMLDTVHVITVLASLVLVIFGKGNLMVSLLSSSVMLLFGLLIYAYYEYIRKIEGLGFADVKLFGAMGVLLGLQLYLSLFLISGVAGCILGILWTRKNKVKFFPFGPALYAPFIMFIIFY